MKYNRQATHVDAYLFDHSDPGSTPGISTIGEGILDVLATIPDPSFWGIAPGRRVLSFRESWVCAMNRQHTLDLLSSSKPELQARFGVTRLALFGSTARGAESNNSDIDVLVAFEGPATSKRYFGVQFYLEDLLGCPVDLVTEKALRPELRPYIEQERVDV